MASFRSLLMQAGITQHQADVIASGNLYTIDAAGDGVTDDSSPIQVGLNALSSGGGGMAILPSNPNSYKYLHNSTLVIPSNVMLCSYGAQLNYGGSGIQVQTANTGYTQSAGLSGLTMNFGNATTALSLNSPYRCQFRDLTLNGNSASAVMIDVEVNTSGPTNPSGNWNAAFSTFDNVLQTGLCGKFIKINGVTGGTGFATLNSFFNVQASLCRVYGIEFAQWCDSNVFCGMTRIGLDLPVNAAGVGVIFNTASPASEVGVYAETFQHLAVDAFGTPAGDARIGMQLNNCKDINVRMYFQDPPAAGGQLVTTGNTISYDVLHQVGGTNTFVRRTKGETWSIADAPSGYGTPTNISLVSSFPGTAANLAQTSGTLAALIRDLKASGYINA